MAKSITNRCASGAIVGAIAVLTTSLAWAEAFEHRALEQVYLGGAGGKKIELLQQEVPAGTWLITAKVSIDNAGDADYFSCELLANGESVDTATTMIGSAGGMPAVATLSNQRILSVVEPTLVALICSHNKQLGLDAPPLPPIDEVEGPPPPPVVGVGEPLPPRLGPTLPPRQLLVAGEVGAGEVGEGPPLGPVAERGASLIASRVGDAPPSLSCGPVDGCLPGHLLREQEDVEGDLPPTASPLESGYLCVEEAPVTLADPCLARPSLEVRDTWLYEPEQGPLYNTCPRRERYMWCTEFGYCWCSSNPG